MSATHIQSRLPVGSNYVYLYLFSTLLLVGMQYMLVNPRNEQIRLCGAKRSWTLRTALFLVCLIIAKSTEHSKPALMEGIAWIISFILRTALGSRCCFFVLLWQMRKPKLREEICLGSHNWQGVELKFKTEGLILESMLENTLLYYLLAGKHLGKHHLFCWLVAFLFHSSSYLLTHLIFTYHNFVNNMKYCYFLLWPSNVAQHLCP